MSVAIVGIDSFSFASLPVTHGHQGIKVQQARRTQEIISFVQNDVLYYKDKVSPYSNSRLQHNNANTQNEV
jgi:hypothetical protein